MDAKLTLRLKKRSIEKAKEFAHLHKTSISRMVESYFDGLAPSKSAEIEITPLVESLSGVITFDDNQNHKSNYASYLSEKYK